MTTSVHTIRDYISDIDINALSPQFADIFIQGLKENDWLYCPNLRGWARPGTPNNPAKTRVITSPPTWTVFVEYDAFTKANFLRSLVKRTLKSLNDPISTRDLLSIILHECGWTVEDNNQEEMIRRNVLTKVLHKWLKKLSRKTDNTYERAGRTYHRWEWLPL